MPKIHKIRIVGLKYDGMQKQYKDTTFDFHNEETSVNSLISMMNGGGKGVFLQAIFQIVKPGTAWGKQNNRYYQQFFFNQKEQFIPYTFHVLIQWELDGSDRSHLITGGMFSAEQQISMKEESETGEQEAQIIPKITFYTREFERKEEADVEHIPLFENDEVVDSGGLKDYLRWNGFDVYKDTKKHYRILDTYAINRKDWDILKEINKDEGGVGKYFEGAEDDHSLFQKRIVPTISQVLHRTAHQKNDLVEIFKSQASIAKDLPVLLKREQAHKEFLEDIVPFEEHLAVGAAHKDLEESSLKEGRKLLGALEHLKQLEEEMLDSLEKELEQYIEKQADLRYQKDNLEYAKAHREVMDWEKQLAEERVAHEAALVVVNEKQERKDELEFQLLLKEWNEIEQTIQSLAQAIAKLEENSGLEEVNQKMIEVQSDAKMMWKKASEEIQQAAKHYFGYQKYLKKQANESSKREKQKTQELATIRTEIGQLDTEIHEHEIKEAELTKEFSDRLTYDLQGLIDRFTKQMAEKQSKIEEITEKEQAFIDLQNQLATSHGTLSQAIQFSEEKCEELKQFIDVQKEKESKLASQLYGIIDSVIEPFTHSLLSKYALEVDELLTHSLEQAESIKKELWETQLDYTLNDEHFWIANKDVKELKEWIDEKTGIDVFYGSQFLQSLAQEELAYHLLTYPLLPYGLVVSRQQWENINKQLLTGRLFNSPVPVFLREEMKDQTEQPSFVILNGTEKELLIDKQQFSNWKIQVAKTIEEKQSVLSELEKTEKMYRRVLKELHLFEAGELASDLEKAFVTKNSELLSKKAELHEIISKQVKEKEAQLQLKNELENTEQKLEQQMADVARLEQFKNDKEVDRENRRVKHEKEKQKTLIIKEQTEASESAEQFIELQSTWNQTYLEWKLPIEQSIKKVAVFIDGAVFPKIEKGELTEDVPPLSDHIVEDVLGKVRELRNLQKSKEEQAQELVVAQTKKEAEQKQQQKLEKKLVALHEEWKEVVIPDEPVSILETLLQTAKKDLRASEKAEREQGTAVTRAETSLQHAMTQRDKSEKKVAKYEKQAESWESLDLEVKAVEIKDQTKKVKDEIKQTEKRKKESENNRLEYESAELACSVILKEDSMAFTEEEIEKIKHQGKACIIAWGEKHQDLQEEGKEKRVKVDQSLRNLKRTIEDKDWEIRFKNEVLTTLDHIDTRHYEHVQSIVWNMKKFSQSGLEQLERDKERAEKAQNFWASRASMKVMSIAEAIRSMIAKMRLKNERGTFPLVQLKEDILPKRAEDIEPLLEQHFITAINQITKQFDFIDDHNRALNQEIKQLVSDEKILFVALRNRYPELLVYNMRTDNAFMYGKPLREHYSTWQTINQGSKTKSDGSGGQKLSARMIMMMLLLSVKSETDQSWVPLVVDNPFGQAASAHVLDPIFAVAQKLKFQFIIVTPPELVKTEISQRFESYYKLDFTREKGKEIVTDTVVPAFRIHQE